MQAPAHCRPNQHVNGAADPGAVVGLHKRIKWRLDRGGVITPVTAYEAPAICDGSMPSAFKRSMTLRRIYSLEVINCRAAARSTASGRDDGQRTNIRFVCSPEFSD